MGSFNIVFPLTHSFMDYPDKLSGCISVFIAGCSWGCKNCQNKELQNPKAPASEETTAKELFQKIVSTSDKWRTNKVALMGGDPLYPPNIKATKELLDLLNYNKFETIIYTGYSIDYVQKNNIVGWTYLKSGLYEEGSKQVSEKTDDFFILGSKNQKIYNNTFKSLTQNGVMRL